MLILVGGLSVHRGRYAFASPEHEHHLSAAHAYLPWLSAAAAVVLFLAVVHLTTSLGRGGAPPRLPSGRALWLAASTCLLAVFATQECLETLFAHGHLPGVVELLGGGGWTAVPFAIAAGGVIALLLRGAERVVRWALAFAGSRPLACHAARAVVSPPRTVLAPPSCVLARRLAGRAPPLCP